MTPDDYVKDRVDDQIAWYAGKSRANQHGYRVLKIIELVAAALIPFLAGMGDAIPASAWLLGALGVIVAACAGIGGIYHHQENWIAYRTTAEALKQEKYRFLTGTTPYDGDAAFATFVQRVETLVARENAEWHATATPVGGKNS